MAAFLIYAFNMVAVNFNIVLPINLWTIGFTSLFDISGLIILLVVKIIGAWYDKDSKYNWFQGIN